MVQQHPTVGHHQRVVVGQRHHAGPQPDVLGSLGGGGDEHLRAGDQLITTRVVFAEPGFVEAEPIQRYDTVQIVFECHRGRLASRVKRRDENTETQGRAHLSSSPLRNSNKAAFTSSGRSCCSQCPAPSSITCRYGPEITSDERSARVKDSTGSAVPPINKHGTEILAPPSSGVVSQLRSKLRYQFRPPVKPVRENSVM